MEHTMCKCGGHKPLNAHKRTTNSALLLSTPFSHHGNMTRTMVLLGVLACFVVVTDAFNTDTVSPIIREGPEGSYFGYSLTMHRELGEDMLLVGAPRAATDQPGVQAGGAVYKCPLTPLRDLADCHQLALDSSGNELENGTEITNKSGQMFGATVQSGGPNGPVVVCRPLYTWFVYPPSSPITMRKPIGGCLIARRNFTDIIDYNPCQNMDTDEVWACQLGLSAAVTRDEILMGAVGSFLGKGQVHVLDFFEGVNPYTSREPKRLENSDYKGYSVAFGDFDGDGYSEYIIGTPRGAGNKGTVAVVDAALAELFVAEGTQMGEYFGHTVAASDFNGDGFDDLVISAPMYTGQEDHVIHYDVGRVFIYHNNGDGTFQPPSILMGNQPAGRFGFSLAALGDINQDGFNDLAIGAPHGGETGLGRVYIYHSSGAEGLAQSPSQVIDPASLGLNLASFGFSLAAGMDMDANYYPDLAVGTYKSSAVVLLRSRPVVNIRAQLTADTEGIRLKERNHILPNGLRVYGFNITLCLSYTGRKVPNEISLDYEMIADSQLPVTQRCFFDLIGETKADVIRNQVNLSRAEELCLIHTAYISHTIQDKLTPITLRADYALLPRIENDTNTEVTDIEPILNVKIPPTVSVTVPILRNCKNVTCIPDLSLAVTKNVETLYVGGEKNIVMVITTANRGEDAYQSRLTIRAPPTLLFVKAEQLTPSHDFISTCSNDVQMSTVTCNAGNPLVAGAELKLRVEFETMNLSGQIDLLTFSMDVFGVEAERQSTRRDNRMDVNIPVQVLASMELIGLSNPQEVRYDPLDYPPDREINGESDAGPEVSHYFSLINKGPSHIGPTTVQIEWPLFDENGALLLLLTRASMNNGRKCSVDSRFNTNDLQFQSGVLYEDTGVRPDQSHCVDRASELLLQLSRAPDPPGRQAECCSLRTCATITCRLDSLLASSTAKAEVVISVRSRLWINSLRKGNFSDLRITSRASATTTGSFYAIPFRHQPTASYMLTTHVSRYVEEETIHVQIPLWIYIVAACIGFFIVILLILILWKIGFFKRKKITPEQRKKMEHSDSTSTQKYDPHRFH